MDPIAMLDALSQRLLAMTEKVIAQQSLGQPLDMEAPEVKELHQALIDAQAQVEAADRDMTAAFQNQFAEMQQTYRTMPATPSEPEPATPEEIVAEEFHRDHAPQSNAVDDLVTRVLRRTSGYPGDRPA